MKVLACFSLASHPLLTQKFSIATYFTPSSKVGTIPVIKHKRHSLKQILFQTGLLVRGSVKTAIFCRNSRNQSTALKSDSCDHHPARPPVINPSPDLCPERSVGSRVVYRFGILVWTLRYFLVIYHTDTEGKLGQYFRYFKIGGSPLFPKEGGGLRPPFVHFALLLRDKRNSRQIFKKEFPRNLQKVFPPNRTVKNTQLWDFGKIVIPIPKYRPNSVSN